MQYFNEVARYTQYQDALELAISKALSGQMSSVDALNEAANAWNSITDKIGRSSQKKLYLFYWFNVKSD